MIIDIITGIFLIVGFFYGFSKGIIHSVFSLFALIAGIALALKGSYLVGAFLQESFKISPNFLPIISFLLVVFLTVIIFKITAYILQKILKALSLNFINKLAGGALWILIAVIIISTTVWFADRNNLISEGAKIESYTYRYFMPLAPMILDYLGQVIPFFQSLFEQLDTLFKEPVSA